MATQAQIDIFLRAFYNSWNNSVQDRRAYNFAITLAQAESGLLIGRSLDANGQIINKDGLIDPSLVPTFQSLTDGLARASSGAIVGNANQARDENANATRPIQGSEVLDPNGRIGPAGQGSGTNAQPTPTTENNPTAGTNANTRTISQTQAINNLSNRATAGAGQSTADFAARDPRRTDLGGPGAGARGDDNTPSTPSVLINRLDALYAGNRNFIPSQANILDNFFSYTYSLSWYLVDPTLYNNGKFPTLSKNITGYYLLAQSGGAGTGAGTSDPARGMTFNFPTGESQNSTGSGAPIGAQRSPYFNLDFYIDNLELSTVYSCNVESGGPMTNSNISFTISEPNGITLPTNLFQAVQAVYGALPSTQPKNSTTPASQINYAAALYCMVVRFYGYDEAGQLVVPIDNSPDSTDSSAAVEMVACSPMANWDKRRIIFSRN
jgi:hypothetical protein